MQSNTRAAWQDVPDAAPRSKDELGPKGTWSAAHLVTDYFAVENRTKEPVKWRIPRRSSELETLRRRLRNAQIRFGLLVQEPMTDRPGAGEPLVGPMPVERPAPWRRPSPSRILPLREHFSIPADQLIVPGLTWSFRTMLHRREIDRTPLFSCVGLEG